VNVEQMPFDQYQRYRLVSDLLEQLRGKRAKLEVLDVGGRTALLRGFLHKDHVTLVDVEPSAESGLVLGDGAKLPFRDKAFDVVAAFDTLEHVPPKLRPAFVRECARVSRGYVVLAGPYHTERVAEAEKILQSFLKDKLGFEHRYLEEHRHNGLPSREATERELEQLGAKVESVGHANLERWLALMCLSMYLDNDPALRGLASRVHEFYNRALYASDHAEPVYRHLVIASLGGGPLPKAHSALAAPRAPAGALAPFTELSGELVAFDRERTAWRAERERQEQVNRDLALDLAGHAATLEELERDFSLEQQESSRLKQSLEQQQAQALAAIAALEADLDAHRLTLEQRELEIEQLQQAQAKLEALLASEREQALASIAALQSDLDGHKQHIEALEQEFTQQAAAAAAEREEVREVIDALERDLDGHRESLAHVQRELAAREAHVSELLALAQSEREQAADSIAHLRRELEAQRAAYEEQLGETRALRDEGVRVQALLAEERSQAALAIENLRVDIEALERELERERAAGEEVAQALERDLREHRVVLENQRAEIGALQAALAANDQAARAAQAQLGEQLQAHARVQAELRADLHSHRGALADLHAELERTRVEAHAIQAELIRANSSAEGLGRTLAEREQELAVLRALLRSRAKNLRRAFSFKKPAF